MDRSPRTPTPGDSLTQQRLVAVLAAPFSDSDIRDALAILDKHFVENSAESRRQLRSSVQADVIASNAQIIRDFSLISKQLNTIGNTLSSIDDTIKSLKSRGTAAVSETAPVLQESEQLLKHNRETDCKLAVLNAFREHYTVSEDDLGSLTSSAEPVDDRFFNVLRKVKRIHGDCRHLLTTGNERAGTEIMEDMAQNLNSAFQKLFRWIQRELKSLSLESPQVNRGIRRALRVLAERPTLFQNCLDFFAETRQKIIVDSFYAALTGSVSGSDPAMYVDRSSKPIEFYAHDTLRYVGDILAWFHSTAVGEQETLEVLFVASEQEAQRSLQGDGVSAVDTWVNELELENPGLDLNVKASLMALVDKDMELVCKPLRSRVELAIAGLESTTLSYRLSSLINFYRLTFEKLLGDSSTLVKTIRELEASALRQFHLTLDDHVRSVQSQLPPAPVDLSPPGYLLEALSELSILLKTFASTPAPIEVQFSGAADIFDHALDPYIKCYEEQSRPLSTPKQHIFLLNCAHAVDLSLGGFEVAHKKLEEVRGRIRDCIETLVVYQYERFLEWSGLMPMVEALAGDESSPNTSPPDLRHFPLQQIAQQLDLFLSSALLDARKDLGAITSPSNVDQVVQHATERFITDYEKLDEMLFMSTKSHGESLHEVWPRTVDEVKVLLS